MVSNIFGLPYLNNIGFDIIFEFFSRNFDFKNGCKNDCENKNEKICSLCTNRVYQKINFQDVLTQESVPIAWEKKILVKILERQKKEKFWYF